MFKKFLNLNKLSTLLLYLSILIFIIAFNFSDNPTGGWYQQFLPYLNNRPLADIQFLDSLIGYGITGDHTSNDTNYIIKTTNGGDNWFILDSVYKDLSRVQFLNISTGYICGESGTLLKTTSGGINWISVNSSLTGYIEDMFVLNEDTIWYTDQRVVIGGLFRTTDGGATWIRQYYASGNIPANIYMVNAQIGFFSSIGGSRLNKTLDGGFNWTVINQENGFLDINFLDSLVGWKTRTEIKKTTDGGNSWIIQTLPSGGINGGTISHDGISSVAQINSDTIWCDGGHAYYPGGVIRGALYRTTNNGNNWFFQIPNIGFGNEGYGFLQFINKYTGWGLGKNLIHTLTGGDSLFYTKINEQNNSIPQVFFLHQNYPNPFNPITIIKYELQTTNHIRIFIFDISGRVIEQLVNKKQNSGTYEIRFDGSNVSSGVYFYKLEAVDSKGNIFSETKKMILLR